MGEFKSEDHYIYYCGQEYLRRNGLATKWTKESEMRYLEEISKTEKDLCSFPSHPFSIMVIQVYALTSNAEED